MQALAQHQLDGQSDVLAQGLQNAIQSLQAAAQQQTPAVDLATIMLAITGCLGALTSIKVRATAFLAEACRANMGKQWAGIFIGLEIRILTPCSRQSDQKDSRRSRQPQQEQHDLHSCRINDLAQL